MHINDVLQAKRGDDESAVVTIRPEATIAEMLRLLADHNIGALVVSSDGATVTGIVSERDVVRLLNRDSTGLNGTVDSIMTTDVASCGPRDSVNDLMRIMTDRRIRHVPVVDDGRLVGIVSIGDVVKSRIEQLEFEREQLESYITKTS
jgi:CBS domain-containing protein